MGVNVPLNQWLGVSRTIFESQSLGSRGLGLFGSYGHTVLQLTIPPISAKRIIAPIISMRVSLLGFFMLSTS